MARQARVKSLIAPAIVDFLVARNNEYNARGVIHTIERTVSHNEIKNVIRQLPAPLGFDPDELDDHGNRKNRYRYMSCLYEARRVLEQSTPPITMKPDGRGRELFIGDSPAHTRRTQADRVNTINRISMRTYGILERSSMDPRNTNEEANQMRMVHIQVRAISDQVREALTALEQK